MGTDIVGFTSMLTGYKSIITIAHRSVEIQLRSKRLRMLHSLAAEGRPSDLIVSNQKLVPGPGGLILLFVFDASRVTILAKPRSLLGYWRPFKHLLVLRAGFALLVREG